jgi:UDP-3-O-[3-hydroxymyristoyl] glucosamine N-acyltransferase
LGRHVIIGGQSAIAGHLTVGDNVMLGGQSGITGNTEGGQILSGTPAIPHKEWLKAATVFPRLPAMRKTIAALEKRLAELEDQLAKPVT